MNPNEIHFAFAMTPVEAEMLYRTLGLAMNHMGFDDPNSEAVIKFHNRIKDFTRKHPCRYGSDALQSIEVRIINENQLEAIKCPECGSDNVLEAPADCKSCANWREALRQYSVKA